MAQSTTMCAHWSPFGPVPPLAPIPSDATEGVRVPRRVAAVLRRHLSPAPTPQLGLLFGRWQHETLTLAVAMRAAWPQPAPHGPPEIDDRLLLGASEALRFLSAGQVQGCGVWMMHPDAQLGPADRDARLVRLASRRGWADDRRVLLLVGWADGALGFRAYLGSRDTDVVQLQVEH
jgi:hypothetical protein